MDIGRQISVNAKKLAERVQQLEQKNERLEGLLVCCKTEFEKLERQYKLQIGIKAHIEKAIGDKD